MSKLIISSIFAGVFISFGCCLYSASTNATVGAILFAIGLLVIKQHKFKLFTGVIGRCNSLNDLKNCVIILVGNLIGTFLVKLYIFSINFNIYGVANVIGYNKTEKTYFALLYASIFCGFIMYYATCEISQLQTVLLVATFILCGFEHSIADGFYFMLNGQNDIIPLLIIIIGNAIGANFTRIERLNKCSITTS